MATVASVDPEMPVCRQDFAILREFRHPDQAGICNAHGKIFILSQQTPHIRPMVACQKIDLYHFALDGFKKGISGQPITMQQKGRLRHDGLTGQHGLMDLIKLLRCPLMVLIGSVEKGNEGSCIAQQSSPGHIR
jgi:hypothetical protein